MNFKSWLHRRTAAYRPPLHVCLAYLLVCTMLTTGLSFSRYTSTNGTSDTARVAAGALHVSGSSSATFKLDCNDETTPEDEYTFTVINKDGGKISQVALKYNVVVELSEPLPTGVTITLDGKPGTKNGKSYTFFGGTFASGDSDSNRHTLTITADSGEVVGDSTYHRDLTIYVQAEQID